MPRSNRARRGWQLAVAAVAVPLLAGPPVAATAPGAATPAQAYQRPGATERVSVAWNGGEAKGGVLDPIGLSAWDSAISGDGRYVAFASTATNLVPNDVNEAADIFVFDRAARRTEVVSVSTTGVRAAGACASGRAGSFSPGISPNGRWVVFSSCATNLVPNDVNLDMDGFVHDRATRRTEMVTLSSAGRQGMLPAASHPSFASSISADGRYVGVSSSASDLVPDDTNGSGDAFVYDRKSRRIERISVSSAEAQANPSTGSGSVSLSADGRYAVFGSYADNLVPGDTNRAHDVFVRDRLRGTTERVSVRTGGAQTHLNGPSGTGGSGGRAVSADGRYVMFSSPAANLVPNDSNGAGPSSAFDIFVHDRVTARTERVSVGSDGHEADDDSSLGGMSADGRYVVFASQANNLVLGDTGIAGSNTTTVGAQPGDVDVFLYDRKFGTVEMLSVAPDGTEAKGNCSAASAVIADSSESFGATVSDDGQWVAFQSCARNLVAGDTNNMRDEFARHRGPHLGAGAVSARGLGSVTVTGWVTFSGAVVARQPDPATDGEIGAAAAGAELTSAELLYRPEVGDLFVRLDVTLMPAVGLALGGVAAPGDPRVVYGLRFVFGRVAYEVRAHRVGADPASPGGPAFGLFRCEEVQCTEVAKLRGGYGTTGEQVVISLPLRVVVDQDGRPIGEGSTLSALRAFAGSGGYLTGTAQLFDQVVLAQLASVTVPRRSVTVTVGRTTRTAAVVNGRFSAQFPAGLFRGATRVGVRTCLGRECRTTTHTVRG